MGKSGKGLKGALQSQQARLKEKARIAQAAQAAEQKARLGKGQKLPPSATTKGKAAIDVKGKGKASAGPRRAPTIPFKISDKILLVGEGNFSFTRALVHNPPEALRNLPPASVTATAYDTEKECYEKYPDAEATVAFLREKGVEVLFDIDATRLEKYASLKKRKFDRISFNFPHAGKGIADQDRNILSNQVLLMGFLKSAAKVLKPGPAPIAFKPKKKKPSDDDDEDEDVPIQDLEDTEDLQFLSHPADEESRGTVLVTLRNVIPYTQWDLPRLAKNPPPVKSGSAPPNPPYTLLRSFQFHRDIWQGYEHRMTKGERAHGKGKTGEGGEDRTWEFYLKDEEAL